MNNKSFYSKFSFFFIALLYLSFYLFSPLFHFHHENIELVEGSKIYHSHLIQEETKNTSTSDSHFSLEHHDQHTHNLELNAVVSSLSTRLTDIQNKTSLYNEIDYLVFINTSVRKLNSSDSHNNKFHQDRYVHSASNVSPPFVSATLYF